MDMVWKERFRTSASKASMNFLRWASKERTQRIRPAASGKFLMWKVNGVLCLIRIQSIGSELSESPKHLFNVKEENWTALGTGGSPRCHLKQRIESNCSEDLFWAEQNSKTPKTLTQKIGPAMGQGVVLAVAWRTLWSCLLPLQDHKVLQAKAEDSKQLFWAEKKSKTSKTLTQQNWTSLVTESSPCCLLKNFVY